MIGVSFGDNFLVSNQREIIELMEKKLSRFAEITRDQEKELQRWEAVKPLLLKGFSGALAGKKVVVFSMPGQEEVDLEALLEEAGADVTLIIIPAAPPEEGHDHYLSNLDQLLSLLPAAGELPVGDLMEQGLLLSTTEHAFLSWPPDCCLLLSEKRALSPGTFFYEFWQELQRRGTRVIALFPWQEDALSLPEKAERGVSLVDNIDTFWGQVALLEMIAHDISGRYGFGSGSAGLFPLISLED